MLHNIQTKGKIKIFKWKREKYLLNAEHFTKTICLRFRATAGVDWFGVKISLNFSVRSHFWLGSFVPNIHASLYYVLFTEKYFQLLKYVWFVSHKSFLFGWYMTENTPSIQKWLQFCIFSNWSHIWVEKGPKRILRNIVFVRIWGFDFQNWWCLKAWVKKTWTNSEIKTI